jgi:hypothetical protein
MKNFWKKSYGLIGLAIIFIMELTGILRVRYANIWITPIAWYGYILFFDWLTFRRKNASLLMNNPKEFFIMLPISIFLWCIFELHNLLFHNWVYIGLPKNKFLTNFAFAISFATILPAMYETNEFLKSLRLFASVKISRQTYSRSRLLMEILFGLVLILITVIFPSVYTGPLVWFGYLLVFVALNYLIGVPSILRERQEGRLTDMLTLFFSGYICGFVWEALNFWAAAKWIYQMPYFPHIKVFEMPVLGFLGFGSFAIEFLAMYDFVKFWIGKKGVKWSYISFSMEKQFRKK